MASRTLLLAAGLALAGAGYARWKSRSLPLADGPVPDTGAGIDDARQLADDLQRNRTPLEAGMPADRSSDADHARPGFADYARGA